MSNYSEEDENIELDEEPENEENNDAFSVNTARKLSRDDFYIGSRTPTLYKSRNCALILFYQSTKENTVQLATLWNRLARDFAGIEFVVVDLSTQKEIFQAFKEVEANIDHPQSEYSLHTIPTILVYRDGWPQAYYNGEVSYDAIVSYTSTQACRVGYREPYEPEDIVYEGGEIDVEPYYPTRQIKPLRSPKTKIAKQSSLIYEDIDPYDSS